MFYTLPRWPLICCNHKGWDLALHGHASKPFFELIADKVDPIIVYSAYNSLRTDRYEDNQLRSKECSVMGWIWGYSAQGCDATESLGVNQLAGGVALPKLPIKSRC